MTGPDNDEGPPLVPFTEWMARQTGPTEPGDAPAAAGVRSAGQRTAMACAAAWSILPGLVMLISAAQAAATARSHYLAAHPEAAGPPPYLAWLLAIGAVCWTACTAAEIRHAARLGSRYPPLGPWPRLAASPAVRAVRRAAGGMDRRLGAGGGCLGVIVLLVAGPLIVLGWSAITAAAAPLWVLVTGAATLAHLAATI